MVAFVLEIPLQPLLCKYSPPPQGEDRQYLGERRTHEAQSSVSVVAL